MTSPEKVETAEDFERLTDEQLARWESAYDHAEETAKAVDPKASHKKLIELTNAIKAGLVRLVGENQLAIKVFTGENGVENRSVEPVDAETSASGMPLDLFVRSFAVDDAHLYSHTDLNVGTYVADLSKITGKNIVVSDFNSGKQPVAG